MKKLPEEAWESACWHADRAQDCQERRDYEGTACRAHFAALHGVNAFAASLGAPAKNMDGSDAVAWFRESFCGRDGDPFPASLLECLAKLKRLHDQVAWHAERIDQAAGEGALKSVEALLDAIEAKLPQRVINPRTRTSDPVPN